MSTQSICPKCGATLPVNAPKGLCPRCLLSDLVQIGSEFSEGGTTHDESGCLPATKVRYFGDYELFGEIAQGGMGVVYRARQISLNRVVALKMILAGQLANAEEVQRFHTEAEAAAKLDHPNIVPIYEIGEHEGRCYFTMKLIEGRNLAEELSGKPLPLIRAAELLAKVARAVHYAHQRGILHRDLKPTNILLDANGEPYLTDFGLAKLVEKESALTRSMAVMGSADYMSPEQAAGHTGQLTTVSDIYSLGAVLYEVLTGRPPFRSGTLIETVRHVIEEEPEPPQNLNREVDRDLTTICLKCLQKEPQRRYGSAKAVADDLERWLGHIPILARPISIWESTCKWVQRRPAIAALSSSVVILVVSLAIGSPVAAFRIARARDKAEREANRAERAELEVTVKLRESYLAQARANRFSGRAGRRFDSLEVLTKAARIKPGSDLRNEAIACMALPDLRLHKRSRDFKHERGFVEVDRQIERYAVASEEGEIAIYRLSDDQQLVRVPGKQGTFPANLRFSADRRWLAVNFKDGAFRLIDLTSGRMLWELSGPRGALHKEFLPGQLQVAIVEGESELAIYDLHAGERLRSVTLPFSPQHVCFSPSGKLFAVSSGKHKRVVVMDAESGKTVLTLAHADFLYDVRWDPAGERLATACHNNGVYLWDVRTGLQIVRWGGSSDMVSVTFSPNGNVLAGSDWDKIRLWDAHDGRQLATIGIAGSNLRFSPDGAHLSCQHWENEHFSVFDVASADELRAVEAGRGAAFLETCPSLGLLAASGNARVLFFNDDVQDPLASLPYNKCPAFFDAFAKNLFVNDQDGLGRWLIKKSAGKLEVGPREALPLPRSTLWRLTGDGKSFVAPFNDRLCIYDAATFAQRISTEMQVDMLFMETSPDGEWIATGTWHHKGVKVWNAHTGKLESNLPSEGIAVVRFSPEGRWLAVRDSRHSRFWNVGAWTPSFYIESTVDDIGGCSVAFTQNGRIAALRHGRSNVRLVDTARGNELALLESPEAQDISSLCFVADDTRLIVATKKNPLYVWDLRRIRQQLASMGLDWEAPPLPARVSKPLVTAIKVITNTGAERSQ